MQLRTNILLSKRLCKTKYNFSTEITVGFTQSVCTATEDDDFVLICAELLEGELGTDIYSFIGSGDFRNDSGRNCHINNILLHIKWLFINFIATNGQDYMGLPTIISFVSRQSLHSPSCVTVAVTVAITDDAILEETENFTVVLSTEFPGVTTSRAQSIVEIVDNDNSKRTL